MPKYLDARGIQLLVPVRYSTIKICRLKCATVTLCAAGKFGRNNMLRWKVLGCLLLTVHFVTVVLCVKVKLEDNVSLNRCNRNDQ